MTDTTFILVLIVIALCVAVVYLMKEINRLDHNSELLEDRLNKLDDWAVELDKWIDEGGDQYLGLDFDIDMFKAETEERIREELKKEYEGEK